MMHITLHYNPLAGTACPDCPNDPCIEVHSNFGPTVAYCPPHVPREAVRMLAHYLACVPRCAVCKRHMDRGEWEAACSHHEPDCPGDVCTCDGRTHPGCCRECGKESHQPQ